MGYYQKKPLSTDGVFRLCRWTVKSIKYCCYFLCVCLHFAGRRISHFTEDFSKTLPSFWQSKKSPVLSREKGRYYRLSAERRWTPWHLIAGNLKSNVRFKSSVNQCCTMKRATPMRKFVGAEFGKLLFPTLPCMRNGSFIPSIRYMGSRWADTPWPKGGTKRARIISVPKQT